MLGNRSVAMMLKSYALPIDGNLRSRDKSRRSRLGRNRKK